MKNVAINIQKRHALTMNAAQDIYYLKCIYR